ncbi:ester cyclase [Pseudomonas sp. HR96]|uniref:ester cyclase n=1 Tax=Pseudomonas sp. HR96 TaxID=1027966 RepID=UPI002A76647D|nr:ester cyclase [Pseudomonas sp. HR96]WPO97809.1 ester cyclase [Pseudomonas sp. HR96]
MIDLATLYRHYIDCLNRQAWDVLGQWVAEDVHYNGKHVGLDGYRAMLERDFRDIPDLSFNIALLVADAQTVAARLAFDCSPSGVFLGVAVNGRRVQFSENVFYQYQDEKIAQVWSVLEKTAVEAQIG